ncbi:hypothetical protein AZE42_06343, partial [Rhizopogon vesiculosus]
SLQTQALPESNHSWKVCPTTSEDFESVLSVNVKGTFHCYKYAAQQMIAQGDGGRIIGASSLAGKKGKFICRCFRCCMVTDDMPPSGHAMLSAYCASKFAVRGLTQTAAIEFGHHGITVNAYAPGPIYTSMLAQLQQAAVERSGDLYEEMKRLSSVGYLGNTQDVGNLVSFLVTPEARFITGQSITIDGGIFFD